MKNLYYFVSDVHLGLRAVDTQALEKRFLGFLNSLPPETKALYLLGDIFDFWYEYKYVIPRGHTRVLGRLAQLHDQGVEIYFFTGNHDVWAYDYFESELGMKVLEQPAVVTLEGKNFCLGHGDGLGYTTPGFRFIRWAFHNKFLQTLFSAIHPKWAFSWGYAWSYHTRLAKTDGKGYTQYAFKGKDEPIYKYSLAFGNDYTLKHPGEKIDYYIFGHFHTPARESLPDGGTMFILGEWINICDYIVFDGESISVEKWGG